MKKNIILLSLVISAFFSCKQVDEKSTETEEKIEKELPALTGNDTTFSDQHYLIASEAISTLKNKDYKKLEEYMVTEFLPPQGFEKVDFIVTIADYIKDKDLPNKDAVTLRVGRNTYKDKKIPFKTYNFPFYQISDKDTIGRSAIVVTIADGIEKNKIANLSFRDY